MSEKRKNTDRREAFQLAIGSTNRPAGGKKNDSYPALRNYTDSSEWQYQWVFFICIFIFSWQQRKQKSRRKDIERFRINIKMREAGKTTHGPFLLAFWGLVSQNMMPSFTFPLAVQVCQAKPEMNYLQNRTRHTRQVSKGFVAMSHWPQPNPHLHHYPHPPTSVCCNAIALQITEERNVCSSL